MSALSRLSRNTPVIPRIMSRLSVARVRILSAACVAATVVGLSAFLDEVREATAGVGSIDEEDDARDSS